jgi:hypothetical protein
MCTLCSSDPKVVANEKARIKRDAADLERVAKHMRAMVTGDVDPHADDPAIRGAAMRCIRVLAEDWL